MSATETAALVEDVWVPVRIIAAPVTGVFRADPRLLEAEETTLSSGQEIGTIQRATGSLAVPSPHEGRLGGLLVCTGERVREGQPLAWVQDQS